MKATITVKTTREILLPTLPNFFRTENGDAIPVESVNDSQLEEIGRQWTDALKRKAHERRFTNTAEANRRISKES